MIFVTTGTQEPFDRLLKVISFFADESKKNFIIQAKTSMSFPENVIVKEFMGPKEFSESFRGADLIISHAGMGTIISALKMNKPLVVFPRIAALGEHRNEHQMATARKMKELDLVTVSINEDELIEVLSSYFKSGLLPSKSEETISEFASSSLINSLEEFINI